MSSVKGNRLQGSAKGVNLGHYTKPHETECALTLQAELAKGVVNQQTTYVYEKQ